MAGEGPDTVETLKEFCRKDGRVCPMPKCWNDLWESLPARRQLATGGWEPAVPLVLGAWYRKLPCQVDSSKVD